MCAYLCPVCSALKKRKTSPHSYPLHTMVAETAKSRYEGKRLPSAKRAARQLRPVFPELLEEVAVTVTWKDKPFTSKMPVQGGSALDVEGMEKEGLLGMPPIEPLVATHLHPKHMEDANLTLPSKADRFQSSMTERTYKAVALSVRALNAISLLSPWEEICVVMNLSLCL